MRTSKRSLPEDFHDSKRKRIRKTTTQLQAITSWDQTPYLVLLEVFKHLSDKSRCVASQVCRAWNNAFKNPSLWRSKSFVVGGPNAQNAAFRAIQFTKLFGHNLQELRITCRHLTSSTCKLIIENLEAVFLLLAASRLRLLVVAELELDRFWRYPNLRTSAAICLVNFIQSQSGLEEFAMKSAQFSLQQGVCLLDVLAAASGPKITTLDIEDFFSNQNAVGVFGAFKTVLLKFENLSSLALNYCYLSDELMEHLALVLKGRLKRFTIRANHDEPGETISNKRWSLLKLACPNLAVYLTMSAIIEVDNVLQILAPSMPLVSFYMWPGFDPRLDTQLEWQLTVTMNHVANHFHESLEELVFNGDNFPDSLDDELIRTIARCNQLRIIRMKITANINGLHFVRSLCGLLKEDDCTLKDVCITLCDIFVPDDVHARDQINQLVQEMQPFIDTRGIDLEFRSLDDF
ncbi:F-box only protein 39-like [Physella acuta]|uniref:F-box only protein 39-like n=1 Tax=Physella acuta TaxID=109671 RepID=UPI0027DADF12|nr:F-box only protein 39-like [Physella acuta]